MYLFCNNKLHSVRVSIYIFLPFNGNHQKISKYVHVRIIDLYKVGTSAHFLQTEQLQLQLHLYVSNNTRRTLKPSSLQFLKIICIDFCSRFALNYQPKTLPNLQIYTNICLQALSALDLLWICSVFKKVFTKKLLAEKKIKESFFQ